MNNSFAILLFVWWKFNQSSTIRRLIHNHSNSLPYKQYQNRYVTYILPYESQEYHGYSKPQELLRLFMNSEIVSSFSLFIRHNLKKFWYSFILVFESLISLLNSITILTRLAVRHSLCISISHDDNWFEIKFIVLDNYRIVLIRFYNLCKFHINRDRKIPLLYFYCFDENLNNPQL